MNKNLEKALTMSMAARLEMATDMLRLGIIKSQEEFISLLDTHELSVEYWLGKTPTNEQLEQYPNAKKAAKLKASKLYKALK